MAALLLSYAPTKVAHDLDIAERPAPTDPEDTVATIGLDLPPLVETQHRAVNGFVRVTRIDGKTIDYYVGHNPQFIAEQLTAAKNARVAVYYYWDRPGYADAKRIPIVTAVVERVEVRFLEADIDALYDDLAWL